MKIDILGCSGGMGLGQHTTCFRVNEQILLDAGSGLGNLTQHELLKIKTIFLTHAHLDHICFLPLLIDNLFESLKQPIQVYALPEVIETLQQHIFNWQIWPDFSKLPSPEHPVLTFHPIKVWNAYSVNKIRFTPFPVEHVVPTCGFHLESESGKKLAFTGDTTYGDQVLETIDQLGPLDVLMTECAFPDRLIELSKQAKHLTPSLLKDLLKGLQIAPKQVWLSHLKPSQQIEIRGELERIQLATTQLQVLEANTSHQV